MYKKKRAYALLFCVKFISYSAEIAPTGQTSAHVPQSTHVAGSILYCVSPSEIAPTGHSGSQEPQLTQASEITYAIMSSSLKYKINEIYLSTLF